MWIGIIAIILGSIIYSISKFKSDMSNKNKELEEVGGIKEKYKVLISRFDNYDIYKLPQVLTDKTNDFEIGWAGITSNHYLWFQEVNNDIWIKLTIEPNKSNPKMKSLMSTNPKIKTEVFEWKFPTNMSQYEMGTIILNDISRFMDEYAI